MAVWVLMVLAVVWVIALTPMVLRKFSERSVVNSVTSFHCQLLRLGGAVRPNRTGSIRGTALDYSAATLRLWEERSAPSAASVARPRGAGLRDSGRPEFPASSAAGDAAPRRGVASLSSTACQVQAVVATSPQMAGRRRRVVSFLGAITVLFFVLGVVPGASMLWDLSLVSLALLLGYLAALVHLHRLRAERASKVVALQARHDVVSALDEARRSTSVQAGGRWRTSSGSGGGSRGSAPGTRAPFGKGSVGSDLPLRQELAASR